MLFRMTLVAASLSAASSAYAAVASKYDIVELPRLCDATQPDKCGDSSFAYDINNAGAVVGISQGPMVVDTNDSDGDGNTTEEVRAFSVHAIRWQGGVLTDLGHLGKNESYGFAVNEAGATVGRSNKVTATSSSGDTIQFRAFQASTSSDMTDIGVPSQPVTLVSATDITDAGHIVGYSIAQAVSGDTTYYNRGFVKQPGSDPVLIPSLQEKTDSALRSANSTAGLAVGYSVKDAFQRAIQVSLTAPGSLVELGDLGGSASSANGINNAGLVVGSSQTTGNKSTEGFIYNALSSPTMRSIGLLDSGLPFSSANAINNLGDVVGVAWALRSPTTYHAVIYSSAASEPELIDLNERIDCAADPTVRWTLTEALAINDSGQIIGYGSKGTSVRAFLLTPRPSSDTTAPVTCAPTDPEFENKSGGGAMFVLTLPVLLWLRRRVQQ